MMKSALATVAIAAVASSVVADTVPVYQLAGDNGVGAITCMTEGPDPEEQIGSMVNTIPTATDTNTYYALYPKVGVTAAAFKACVESLTQGEEPVLTLMGGPAYAGCFVQETTGEGDSAVTTVDVAFNSDACYILPKEKCTTGQKCQNIWFDGPADCPAVVAPATESTCPVEAPKHLYKIVSDLSKHWSEDIDEDIPEEIEAARTEIRKNANKACASYPPRFAPDDTTINYSYISNRKGTQATMLEYYRGECDFKKEIFDKLQDAIKAYNKDKAKADQFVSDVLSYTASASKDNISMCDEDTCGQKVLDDQKKPLCTLPCDDGEACTDNKQCGSGVCAEEAAPEPAPMKAQQDPVVVKTCTSNAILAAAAPVVAAVLAVAFF